MVSITLDTNCLIDLEEGREDSKHLVKIIDYWRKGKVSLSVVAVSASENQKAGESNKSYAEFERKLGNIGLEGAEHLLPIGVWNLGYWNHFLWADEEMTSLKEEIRNILFPKIAISPPTNIAKNSKWRNQLCDVLVAWCHAYHKTDYLITRDSNFHKHKLELEKVGVRNIIHPIDAVKICQS